MNNIPRSSTADSFASSFDTFVDMRNEISEVENDDYLLVFSTSSKILLDRFFNYRIPKTQAVSTNKNFTA